MRMTTPQRVLAIVGGAFLLGTGQAFVTDPIVLEEANITSGTGNVKGGAPRGGQAPVEDPVEDPTPVDPVDETEPASDPDPIDDPGDEPGTSRNSTVPTASFTGSTLEQLLDAPVPEGSLTLREARELWELGAYFIDARYEHEYEAGHIQYAALLPAQMFDTNIDHANSVMDSIPLDATIVLYCVGGDCDASKNTAALLEQYGYSDLRIMGAGYEHWVAAGFETASGADGEVSP